MALVTDSDSQAVLERAAEARRRAVDRLAAHIGTPDERQDLAGTLFREYSRELLEDLLRISTGLENGEGTWLRERHDEQLLELGRELRDVFPEGEARHGVAQVIQRELLEAERRLKCALRPDHAADPHEGSGSPV